MHISEVWPALGVLSFAAWVYLLGWHGGFWRVWGLELPAAPRAMAWHDKVVAVIPARNEADVIDSAVRSLLHQYGPSRIHVVVVDDHSDDGTAEVARKAASSFGRSECVTVVSALPLQPGWTGKTWAMQQGVEHALRMEPDFLLLTDADVEHAPNAITELLTHAHGGDYQMVSLMVRLQCNTLAEKLLIPAFVFFFFMLYPPAWVRQRWRKTSGAAGGCMLIRPSALADAGGIAAIRGEIIDDCALAKAVKRTGGSVWLGISRESQSLRGYQTFGAIEHMISRTAFNQLRHSAWLLLGTVLGMLMMYVAPLGLMLSGHRILALLGGFSYFVMSCLYWPMVLFYGLGPQWAMTLPASAVFYLGATVHSALKYWGGKGGEWKGRTQDVQTV